MHPVLLETCGVTFGSYRTCLTIAFVVGTFLVVSEVQRRKEGFVVSPVGGIWTFFGALLGAKAFCILQYQGFADLWRSVLIWQGGLVFHGGLAGGILAITAYLRFCHAPWWKTFDVIAAIVPLGQAITRVGCFLSGCCHGTPTDVPWSVQFPLGSEAFRNQVGRGVISAYAPHTLPVHPAQLYMVAGLIAMFVVLKVVLNRKQTDGVVGFSYLALYGFLRFTVEFVRGDNDSVLMGLTLYQLISVLLVLTAVGGLVVLRLCARSGNSEEMIHDH